MKKRNPTTPRLVLTPEGDEDVIDRGGAAAGQLVAVDDAVGRALAPELSGRSADDDGQWNRGGECAGGQGDRAVEARNLLEPVDDAQHELRPKPECQGTHDALALRAPSLRRLAVGHESRT